MREKPLAILLFSGGLDSILAAKILEEQDIRPLCQHFCSPFFGREKDVERWRRLYGLDIQAMDISRQFVEMLLNFPQHGFGKNLNPCLDCKILQLKIAREIMVKAGARFMATGEVIGQRPMSQRRDTMNLIERDAAVRGCLLRPLSARLLSPTEMETSGLIEREGLEAISGRGRERQLELAAKFGLRDIPTPGGGCWLTEREKTRRYWPILKKYWQEGSCDTESAIADFRLANCGRQLWHGDYWLTVGRTASDNENIKNSVSPNDLTFKLIDIPGPIGLARDGMAWPADIIAEAASVVASHAPKATNSHRPVKVSARGGSNTWEIETYPHRHNDIWTLCDWENVRKKIKEAAKR